MRYKLPYWPNTCFAFSFIKMISTDCVIKDNIVAFFCLYCLPNKVKLFLFLVIILLSNRIYRGPPNGSRGKVVLLFDDNPLSKIGVRFDKPIPDGVDLGGCCEGGQGFFCHGNLLSVL